MNVAAIVVLAALCAPGGDVRKAAQLEAWGDLVEARAEVESALAKDPRDPAALFVTACLDIEEGKWEAAKARAAEPALARLPQAQVLLALVERRRTHPGETLRDALAPAWSAAGRPDLSAKALPGIDDSVWEEAPPGRTGEHAWSELPPGERVLFGSWTYGARRDDAIAASAHPERNSMSVNHELLGALRRGGDALDATSAAAAARVGQALEAADPDNGYWAFAAWSSWSLEGAPLGTSDLDLLERAASRPRFELPRTQLLEEIRSDAARLGLDHARCRAGRAGLTLGAPLGYLQMRARVTVWRGPEAEALRARTATIMRRIGRRLADSRTYLEHLVGLSLAEQGARLSGDSAALAEERPRLDRARDGYHRAAEAKKRAGTWPFSSSCVDWSPDEVSHFERYLD